MWRKDLRGIVPIAHIGGPRRLFLAVQRQQAPPLFIAAVRLPPGNATYGDAAWCKELDELEQDFEQLKQEFAANHDTLGIFLVGDMNMQPGTLRAGPDRRSQREAHWNRFVSKHDLRIANASHYQCQPMQF